MNKLDANLDILMATYNGEKFIREQLDSLLSQTYTDFNLIIADDGSNDSTLDILLVYQQQDPRVRVIQNKKNLGVIKNFEQLINLSKSKYFMLCDQDDVWTERKIEKSVEAITVSNSLLVYSDLVLTDENLNMIHSSYIKFQGSKLHEKDAWKTLLVQNVITGCTIIADKKIKDYLLPFPENIAMHDAWIALTASAYGDLCFIDEPLTLYRQHESNIIGGNNSLGRMTKKPRSYKLFAQERKQYLQYQMLLLSEYKKRFMKNLEINQTIEDMQRSYNEFLKVEVFSIGYHSLRFKLKHPSLGLVRNFWWFLYLGLPIFSYILLSIKKIIGGIKNVKKE